MQTTKGVKFAIISCKLGRELNPEPKISYFAEPRLFEVHFKFQVANVKSTIEQCTVP